MDIHAAIFWAIVLPCGLILWVGLIGFVIWSLTEPLAHTAEKITTAIIRAKEGE